MTLLAGSDEPLDDKNKLKTKVRRLYDIANVLTTLNLIAKVHIPPSRRPAFVWLGIEGIHIQSHQPATEEQASNPHALLTGPNASQSEAASSTATGSSMQDQTHLRHLSSCTLNTSSMTQEDSQSTCSKGFKRSAASHEMSPAQKCARTASPEPSNILYGSVTSPQRPAPPAALSDSYSEEDAQDADAAAAKAEFSPGMGQQPHVEEPGKRSLRPTPVPITPEGSQQDAQQRQKVCHDLMHQTQLHAPIHWAQSCITAFTPLNAAAPAILAHAQAVDPLLVILSCSAIRQPLQVADVNINACFVLAAKSAYASISKLVLSLGSLQ